MRKIVFSSAVFILIISCAGSPQKQNASQTEPASLRETTEAAPDPPPVTAPQSEPEPVVTETPVDEEEPVEEVSPAGELAEIEPDEFIFDESLIEEILIEMFEKIADEEIPAEETEQPAITEAVEAPPEPVPPVAAAPPPPPAPPPPARPAVPRPPQETPVPVRETEPPPAIEPAIAAAIAEEPLPALEWPAPSPDFRPLPDEAADVPMAFSRVVRATVGQLIEVPFRGLGWVFLGEANARRGIAYDSRRLDPEGQSFIFRAEAAGTYALKFYRQDFIRDYILNDYVQVIIGGAPETAGSGWFNPPVDRGRVIAQPRWPAALDETSGASSRTDTNARAAPPAPQARPRQTEPPPVTAQARPQQAEPPSAPVPRQAEAPAATPPVPRQPPAAPQSGQTRLPPAAGTDEGVIPVRPPVIAGDAQSVQPQAELPPDSAPDVYLKKVKEEYDAGRIASAISLLDQFQSHYPSGSDEAWWLYGQCLETNSPSRNILGALGYYRRLVNEYPQSGRATDARRRIAYLERYYINIQ